jgi:putative membrane protein
VVRDGTRESIMFDHGWGHGTMGIFWILALIGAAVFVYLLVRSGMGTGQPGGGQDSPRESAREILDRRYANGEITKQQYEDMRKTLER